jgi:hypothetical protein
MAIYFIMFQLFLSRYPVSSKKSLIVLDGKITLVANNEINWHIGFQLIKSWDILTFVGFFSGVFDLYANRFQIFNTVWVKSDLFLKN